MEHFPAILAGFLQLIKFVNNENPPASTKTHIFTGTTSSAENVGFTIPSNFGITTFVTATDAKIPSGIPAAAFIAT